MQHCRSAAFLQHIQIVVAGSTVRAQANANALVQHCRYRCDTACQLQVALRVVRYTHVLGSHDVHILVGQMYAVRSNGSQLKHAQLIHQLNRCHAMLFNNGINLKFSFAQMHLDFSLVGAKTLGFADTGLLEAGQQADIVLWDMHKPYWYPRHNKLSQLVYAASSTDADTVFVAGKLLTFDEEKIYAEAEACTRKLLNK